MSIKQIYASCSVNRYTNVFSSSSSKEEYVFGSGPLLAFWHGGKEGVHLALKGHTSEITAVQYVSGNAQVIASGDASGSIRLWLRSTSGQERWSCAAVWEGHKGAISLCAVQDPSSQDKVLVFTASSVSTVKVWSHTLGEDAPVLVQTLQLGLRLASALQVTLLPNKGILLALAVTDLNIYLYTYTSNKLTKCATLQGHTDWIRTLTFSPHAGDLLLASGSQDYYIRLWRISPTTTAQQPTGLDLLDEEEIATRSQVFNSEEKLYSVSSESVLLGHESWVTSLSFSSGSDKDELPRLLSSSADRSAIIWQFSASSNLWISSTRFGELGATPGLGFFGALWTRTGVACHDWGGSVHSWVENEGWTPSYGLSGHFKEVRDLAWQGKGEWLMSTSLDQTSRLHAPCNEEWHELARPQIHGHDIHAMTIIDTTHGLKFATGAEETIVRLFEASSSFVDSVTKLTGCTLPLGERPMAAVVPPLGLSNRAVKGNETTEEGQTLLKPSTSGPPLEEELLSSTLWPEFEKLYGHGYEIRTLTTSHSGQWLASSCKATSSEHATIHLRDTSNWRLHSTQLSGHTLSITRIEFSPDDDLILSVGRDRSWHLHKNVGDGFVPIASAPKAHSRIIWDACWCASSNVFATASRDKSIKLWSRLSEEADSWKMCCALTLSDAVTAVAACQHDSNIILAAGTESGSVHLYSWPATLPPEDLTAKEVKLIQTFPSEFSHALTVTRLAFSPCPPEGSIRLASGSEDRSIRICDVRLG